MTQKHNENQSNLNSSNNKQFCIKKVVIPENKSSNQSNTHHENPNQSLIKTNNYILPFME